MRRNDSACVGPLTPEQAENRGLAWVMGAFLVCPCHLPLTLWLMGTLLSGTAAGVLLRAHPYLAGAAITALWLAATWHGIRHIRAAWKYSQTVTNRGSSR